VVGIYPSPLRDCDVGASLLAYGSLENDDQVEAVNNSEDRWMNSRQARVRLFNRALRERCEFHNNKNADSDNNNGPLEYRDVVDRLLTESGDGTVVVKDAYRDVSDLNIHLIHETTLQLWVDEWPWYKTLTRLHTGGREGAGFLEYLQETFDEYRKTKPWAERTHVAETEGVQLA